MRVLLSTIGSRGDVQPLVALALALRALGQDVRLCVPPDFCGWIEGLGLQATPIGPELRGTGKPNPSAAPLTPERRRQLAEGTVVAQFETIAAAARGCDLLVGATALQIAAPSLTERLGIPYIFAAYCPAVLPSPRHAPPVLVPGAAPAPAAADYTALWEQDARQWNELWRPILNAQRAAIDLPPVDDVRRHVLTDRPWLAADLALSPWPDPDDRAVIQTGAWILADERPLSPELTAFLDGGEPPIYFGFGSSRAPGDLDRTMLASARALGRRAIVSRGWADLAAPEGPDCLAIDDVNHQALFKRVAAVVHHGGAGTTTAAARAGSPQVIIPQFYDQHYWAQRIDQLGVGAAHAGSVPTLDSLTSALEHTLNPDVAVRAQALSASIASDGARIAAQRIIDG